MELLIRCLSFLQMMLLKIADIYFWYRDRTKAPSIPKNDDPLLRLTATELARRIRDRQITSETVVRTYIERVKEVNPIVNAVVEDRYDEALKDARICDERLATGQVTKAHLEVKMPLYGIPFTVKESCSLKGLSQTGCTLVRRGIKADADGPIVASLKNAGAIPICVTNTPELCSSLDSSNFLFGRTTNPYDGRRVAGGSSGGEAALLGSGASLIGVGSDIAGSIRIPSLFTGIYGHKPTPGIIPVTGHFPISDERMFREYLVTGPMARYVDDLALAMRVMSGDKAKKLDLDGTIDVRKIRVFYLEDSGTTFGTLPVSSDIKQSIRRAVEHLESCGAKVNKSPLGPMEEMLEITVGLFFSLPDVPHILINPTDPKNECNGLVEGLKSLFGMSQYTKSAIYLKLLKDAGGFMSSSAREHYSNIGHQLREKFIEMLGDDGIFLYPSFISPAPVRGKIILQQLGGMYSLIANIFGCPSTQVPMGLNEEGLPIGFQIIASPNQDRLCLAAAKILDKKFGGWIPPPTC